MGLSAVGCHPETPTRPRSYFATIACSFFRKVGQDHHDIGNRKYLGPTWELTDLNEGEREAVDHQSRPSAALILETIRTEGARELERSVMALTLSGFAAGCRLLLGGRPGHIDGRPVRCSPGNIFWPRPATLSAF
tara:strand:- start:16920 stop:17324 length:405 start_codon:yes stop_codon:yes gene_type:complete